MASHSSATLREHTPRAINSVTNNALNSDIPINEAVRQRALAIIQDKSIDAGSRNIIRYGLEINDPLLAELVLRVDAGESIVDNITVVDTRGPGEDESTEQRVEALAEIICRDGDHPGTRSAALLVLMATLEKAEYPKALANTAKHYAFTRCGELNSYGIVDAQIAMLERELLADNSHLS